MTWPHKNHLQLFRALAHLRDERGLTMRLVCTGARYPDFWPRIEAAVRELRLSNQVQFLGHVPETDLRALYRLASCLALPSLYEASSLPIFEGWLDGLPVICSNATALPEQVRDAALLFDPMDVKALADALMAATMNEETRRALRDRGFARLKDFDLQRTAKAYRAVYRRAGGFPPYRRGSLAAPVGLDARNVSAMKVLIVSGAFPPMPLAEANHTLHLAEAMARRGVDVHVLTTRGAVTEGFPFRVHAIMRDWSWRDVPRFARFLRRCGPTPCS